MGRRRRGVAKTSVADPDPLKEKSHPDPTLDENIDPEVRSNSDPVIIDSMLEKYKSDIFKII